MALRLKQRMGLQPVAMFPIDRGAPHIPIYTEERMKNLHKPVAPLCPWRRAIASYAWTSLWSFSRGSTPPCTSAACRQEAWHSVTFLQKHAVQSFSSKRRYRLMLKPNRNESKDTQRMIEMWKRDLRLCQEHLWPEGRPEPVSCHFASRMM